MISRKRKTSALYGGPDDGLREVVLETIDQYLDGYAGNEFNDRALHSRLHSIRSGAVDDADFLEDVLQELHFHLQQITTTDEYLRFLGLPKPNNLHCYEFNTTVAQSLMGEDKYNAILGAIHRRKVLFPAPTPGQGLAFSKGPDYLAIALHMASISGKDGRKMLDELADYVQRKLDVRNDDLKQRPEIRSKRARLFEAFGGTHLMSPIKGRSRSPIKFPWAPSS